MGKLKKKEKILLVVLFVVVSIFLLDMFASSDEDKQTTQKTKLERVNNNKETPAKTSEKKITIDFPIKRNVNRVLTTHTLDPELWAKWKRDPFLGAFTAELLDSLQERPTEDFFLKAISWRDSVAYVIINEEVYREGESKNGIHVLDVIGEQVYFTYNGIRKMISFGESYED